MATQSKHAFDPKLFVLGSPLVLSGAAFLVLSSFIAFLLNRQKNLDLPIIDEPGCIDHRKALMEGVSKYPDSPFVISSMSPPLVMLPISVINEVRNLPENKASFDVDVRRSFASKHTGINIQQPMVKAVKNDLTRQIAVTLDDLQDEIRYGFDKELGPCEDWTKFNAYNTITRLVALLSGRVFVGRPLSRNEEWVDATIKYTFYCMEAKKAIESWPVWARDIVAPFLSELKQLKKFRLRGGELLKPILKAQQMKDGDDRLKLNGLQDDQGNFISWLLKHSSERARYDTANLALNQMGLSMAAIHTTSMATTGALFDLAAYPDYIQPLREEIEQVIAEDGHDIDGDGFIRLKKFSMPKLLKLDSFLKESQRLTPPSLASNTRIVTSPITLSTGHTLPTDTRFAFPAYAIHNNPPASSIAAAQAAQVAPLSQFDGWRYYKMRQLPGNETKHQFVTTSPESLNFGHGNHACPGRFFASNEIKVMLIELLREWDFRFVGGKTERPENMFFNMVCMPDVNAEMEFKRRKTAV